MKQYTVEEAYTGNYKVTMFENGRRIYYDIIATYELDGYISCLMSQGYVRAYNVEEYRIKLEEARQRLQWAEQEYEIALNSALIVQ